MEKEKDKIIILGASGLVGKYLFEIFNKNNIDVIGTYNKNKKEGLVYFDILDSSLDDLDIEGVKYAIICSAMVGVDNCKKNLEESREINVNGIKRLIKEFSEKNIIPVFISSVFVFDGDGNYKEGDFRNPANEYGIQKKEVEDFIIENIKEYLIIRLGRVFGVCENEGIFAEILNKYKKGEEILSNNYEDLSFTYSRDIARGIKMLIEKNNRGIFHIDSSRHKNRFEFVRHFFNYLGIRDAKIRELPIENFNFIEKRAKNQFSDSSKFIDETGFQFTPIEECYGTIKDNIMNKRSTVKVGFAEPTHNNQGLSSNTFPYGISFVASYAKKILGNEIEIEIFKYIENLRDYLEKENPLIMCFSNFSWTLDISHEIAKKIKKHSPSTVIVFGGPNFPLEKEEQKKFLISYPAIDFYIRGEGEKAFVELFNKLKDFNFNVNEFKSNRIKTGNCYYVLEDKMINGEFLSRIDDLDFIPSPYLSGMLDKFFDGILIPNIQTKRGCPFCCAYCQEGKDYFNKVYKFSNERIRDELEYIAKRSKVPNLIISDSNFGMFNEDIEICKSLAFVREKYNWPRHIDTNIGKNKDTVSEVSRILKDGMLVGAHVQSTDEKVLEAIGRKNISMDKMVEITKAGEAYGANSFSEIILCLPEDNKDAHMKSMSQMMDLGIKIVRSHQLLMLPGSEISTRLMRKKYKMDTKFRLQPRCFGNYELYNEKFPASEIDELCISNSTMSREDYLISREFDLSVEIFYNNGIFIELINFLKQRGVLPSLFLKLVYETASKNQLKDFYHNFTKETEDSLWDSKEELENFIKSPGMIEKYIKENLRNNEQLKYRAEGFFLRMEELHNITFDSARELLKNINKLDEKTQEYLKELYEFSLLRKRNLLSLEDSETKEFHFDFINLFEKKFEENPFENYINGEIKIKFFHTDEQKQLIKKYLEQFGTSLNGLGFILSRSRADGFYRKIAAVN